MPRQANPLKALGVNPSRRRKPQQSTHSFPSCNLDYPSSRCYSLRAVAFLESIRDHGPACAVWITLGSGLAHPSRRGHSPTSVGGYFSPATLYPFLALSQWVIVGHNSTSPRTAGRFSSPRFISAVSCPQLTPLARMARSQCRVIWPQWFGDETRWDSPVRNTDPPRMAQRCPAPAPCRDTPHGDCVQVTFRALGHTIGAGRGGKRNSFHSYI